jgi:hypothetical protein
MQYVLLCEIDKLQDLHLLDEILFGFILLLNLAAQDLPQNFGFVVWFPQEIQFIISSFIFIK